MARKGEAEVPPLIKREIISRISFLPRALRNPLNFPNLRLTLLVLSPFSLPF